MKTTTLFKSILALSVLTPVVALGAGNCEPKDTQLTTAQRTSYIKQCLAEASSPANVRRVAEQQKKVSCEQNARNKALQGVAKTSYVASCFNKNEAREAAEAMTVNPQKKSQPATLERKYSVNETATLLN